MSEIAVLGDGCRLSYRFTGLQDGPCVVFMNSLGTTSGIWDAQVQALASTRRILLYDMRGHGASDVSAGAYGLDRLGRDLEELLDLAGIEQADFCGISLGGMVGQWLACRSPGRVRRLVLANTSPFMGPASAWQNRIDAVVKHGMETVVNAVTERWFTPDFQATHPQKVGAVADMLRTTSANGYSGCCAAIRDMDLRPILPLIRVPTLVIGGEVDPATPPDHARSLVEAIEGARLQMLPGAHLSNVECADDFTKALTDFLNENHN